ncbi:gastrula zinc finger protein XlCGF8.2DB-like isoform X1 [Bombina bombina]|uniref:gastrula zinc finger protein XlCGF8.2DB-like isoform X1 n=2 Tax=Bombina bombina TaxID=8345 RepID=UPI00235AA802|nr:gastrula zinc finger protein XlCGF8.2DB-like isoform X1 [Bombina bombina]
MGTSFYRLRAQGLHIHKGCCYCEDHVQYTSLRLPVKEKHYTEYLTNSGSLNKIMSDKTENQTSDLPDAHRDEDNTDIVKVEITEDLCVRHQLGATDEETSDSISSGHMDVTPSDDSASEHGGEPYEYDQVKTEEDEVPINTTTGGFTSCSKSSHGQSADASFNLFKNQRRHMGNICSECGKCFTRKSYFLCHLKIHTGDKPFSCSECGKCFTNKAQLGKHQTIHTGKKGFSCPDCGKCFTQKSTLITHQNIHTGVKAFLCSECGKCFTSKSSLIRHQKIHRGEKDFVCSECGKCFTLKSHLNRHQKSHTGEKAFLCSVCGKCFTLKSTLDNHIKIHTGEKAFSCSKCGKCFTQQSTLINHQKTHMK